MVYLTPILLLAVILGTQRTATRCGWRNRATGAFIAGGGAVLAFGLAAGYLEDIRANWLLITHSNGVVYVGDDRRAMYVTELAVVVVVLIGVVLHAASKIWDLARYKPVPVEPWTPRDADTERRTGLSDGAIRGALDRIDYRPDGGDPAEFFLAGSRFEMVRRNMIDSRIADHVGPVNTFSPADLDPDDDVAVFRICFSMAVDQAIHEVCEWFKVDGAMILDAHDPFAVLPGPLPRRMSALAVLPYPTVIPATPPVVS